MQCTAPIRAQANIAMAASGTVSLELAMARLPHVIAYRMNALTVAIVRALHGINQKYANLVNILLDREVVPEFIQERCRANLIADGVLELLSDRTARETQLASVDEALAKLRPAGGSPSNAAATVVMSLIGK